MKDTSLFIRLGLVLQTTDKEVEQILNGDTETLKKIIADNRFYYGDTYIPQQSIEDYNEANGTDYSVEDDYNIEL